MTKRADTGPVVTSGQVSLFDVKAPTQPAAARRAPTSVPCKVCGRALRSPRSMEAGAGQACAAKVGRSVLAHTRSPRRSKTTTAA